MTNKETNLKEKFKQALESTARVISDDLSIKEKSKDDKNLDKFDFLNIGNLDNKNSFVKARAEADSSALKKKFSDELIFKKNLPSNSTCRSLYSIAEKIRYETL